MHVWKNLCVYVRALMGVCEITLYMYQVVSINKKYLNNNAQSVYAFKQELYENF